MKTKPFVGQIVFSLNVGNAARRCEQKLTKCEVVSVGRKYFEVSRYGKESRLKEKHEIDGWRQAGDFANSQLYESEKEYEDEKTANELFTKIKNCFGGYGKSGYSLDTLKQIVAILDKDAT